MTALWLYASISSNIVSSPLQTEVCSCLSASKVALEPGTHAVEHRLRVTAQGAPAPGGHDVVPRVEQQPYARGINRIAHHVGQALHLLGQAEPDGHVKHFLGELDGAFHLRAAAGQDDARGDDLLEAAAPQFLADEPKQLLVARLDDLSERLAR